MFGAEGARPWHSRRRLRDFADAGVPARHGADERGARFRQRGGRHGAAISSWLRATQPIGFGWMANDLNEYGAMGDAANATAAKGEACADHGATRLHRTARRRARVRSRAPRQGPAGLTRMGGPHFNFERELIARRQRSRRRRRRGRPRPARRAGRRRGGDPRSSTTCPPASTIPRRLIGGAARGAVRDHLRKALARLARLRQRRGDRRAQHSRRDAAGDGARRQRSEPARRLRADRRPRRAAGPALPGARDHRRRRACRCRSPPPRSSPRSRATR